MACQCQPQVVSPECRQRGWFDSVFDDCLLSDGLMGSLMGALALPPMKAGGRFSLGAEVSGWTVSHTSDDYLEEIKSALISSGYVQPNVRVFKLTSFWNFNPYISVEGQSVNEHGSATDLQNTIVSIIRNAGFHVPDGSVRFEAETFNPDTGQQQTTRYEPTGTGPQVADTGAGFFDDISASLGISGTDSKLLLVGAALLVTLIILKR